MSLRQFLSDTFDATPRYAAGDRELELTALGVDMIDTPLPEITRNSSSWGDWFGTVAGLPAVTEKTAMTISAVYACVNLIAGAIAAMPRHVFRTTADGEREQLRNDGLWWILNEEFSPRWSAANGWEFLALGLLLLGDGFAIIKRKGAQIAGLEPVHPRDVTVIATPEGDRLIYIVRREDAKFIAVDQDDMLHFAGFGFDGKRGLSPLRHHLRMTGAIALATQEFAARFFSNSARPDILLTTDQVIDEETAGKLRDLWESQYGGLANSHRPAVLGHGAKAEPLTIPAEEAQLLATRQHQIEDIARIYGVPPFMIGHLEKTTSFGKGVEHMGIAFVRFALRQHLFKIQTEINRKFFRTAGKFVEFDTFELERADMKTLFDSYRVALGRAGEPGFITAEEVRNRLNLKREPEHGTLHRGEGKPAPDPNTSDGEGENA